MTHPDYVQSKPQQDSMDTRRVAQWLSGNADLLKHHRLHETCKLQTHNEIADASFEM